MVEFVVTTFRCFNMCGRFLMVQCPKDDTLSTCLSLRRTNQQPKNVLIRYKSRTKNWELHQSLRNTNKINQFLSQWNWRPIKDSFQRIFSKISSRLQLNNFTGVLSLMDIICFVIIVKPHCLTDIRYCLIFFIQYICYIGLILQT